MIRLLRVLLAAMLALAAPALAAAAEPGLAASSDEDRQILVMLNVAPAHYRPNSSYSGAYGDAAMRAARKRAARRIAERHGLALGEGWPMPLLGVDCYVMVVPPGKAVDATIAAVAKESGVAWAQRMTTYAISGQVGAAGDPLYAAQPAAREWKLRELQRSTTGRGMTIAIVDSRIDVDHPDLAGQFVTSQDFVDNRPGPPENHGTGVAGVIAAKAGNGIGISGIAPGARLMALRACWQTERASGAPTVCDSLSLAKALYYALDHGAKVINLSLSGPPDRLLAQLIDVASHQGVTVVAQLRAKAGTPEDVLRARSVQALYDYFNPVSGGPDGDGWPFGRPVHSGEVYAVLQRIPGVELVEDVRLFAANLLTGERGQAVQRIDLPPNGLAFSYGHQVRVARS